MSEEEDEPKQSDDTTSLIFLSQRRGEKTRVTNNEEQLQGTWYFPRRMLNSRTCLLFGEARHQSLRTFFFKNLPFICRQVFIPTARFDYIIDFGLCNEMTDSMETQSSSNKLIDGHAGAGIQEQNEWEAEMLGGLINAEGNNMLNNETVIEVEDSVALNCFKVFVEATGRLMIVTMFFIFVIRLELTWLYARDTYIGRFYIDFSNERETHRLHKRLGCFFLVILVIHLFAVFIPPVFDPVEIEVLTGNDFESFLEGKIDLMASETVNETQEVFLFLFGDDLFRLTVYPFLILPLFLGSINLLKNRGDTEYGYWFGIRVHAFLALFLLIEVIRQHNVFDASGILSLCTNLPILLIFLVDKLWMKKVIRNTDMEVKAFKVSDNYILVYWKETEAMFVPADEKEKEEKKKDSVSNMFLFKLKTSEADVEQVDRDIKENVKTMYLERAGLGFKNTGEMFSLGMWDSRGDNRKGSMGDAPPSLLSFTDRALKLDMEGFRHIRKLQKKQKKRNQRLEAAGRHRLRESMFKKRGDGSLVLTSALIPPSSNISYANLSTRLNATLKRAQMAGVARAPRPSTVSSVDDDSVELGDKSKRKSEDSLIVDEVEFEEFQVEDMEGDYDPFEEIEWNRAMLIRLEWSKDPIDSPESPTSENESHVASAHVDKPSLKMNSWGPFSAGEIDYYLQRGNDIICFATGSGAIFLLDTLRFILRYKLVENHVNLLFSSSDVGLVQWFVNSVDDILQVAPLEVTNVKVMVSLTSGVFASHDVETIEAVAVTEFEEKPKISKVASRNAEAKPTEGVTRVPSVTASDMATTVRSATTGDLGLDATNLDLTTSPRSNKRSAIRFKWGKVVLGRINVLEKFKKLKRLKHDYYVFYQGGSQDLEADIRKACTKIGFTYTGLHSFKALRSIRKEDPRDFLISRALQGVYRHGSFLHPKSSVAEKPVTDQSKATNGQSDASLLLKGLPSVKVKNGKQRKMQVLSL